MGYTHFDTRISPPRGSITIQCRTTRGVSIARELNTLDGVWTGRIQVPEQKRKYGDRCTIRQEIFVRSLRPLLDMPLMAKVKPTRLAQLLNAYWNGIAKVLPEPFDPAGNPKDYVLQKSQGTVVLHSVLPQVIEVIPSWGGSLTDPLAYADAMHDLPALGVGIMADHETAPVSGAKFWLSGSAGMVAQFGDTAGRRFLCHQVRALIPRPPDGLEI